MFCYKMHTFYGFIEKRKKTYKHGQVFIFVKLIYKYRAFCLFYICKQIFHLFQIIAQ